MVALGDRLRANCASIDCAEIAESHLSRMDAVWTAPQQDRNADYFGDSFLPYNLADGSNQKDFRRRCNAAQIESENGYLSRPK